MSGGDDWIGKLLVYRAMSLAGLVMSIAVLVGSDFWWLQLLGLVLLLVGSWNVTWWWSIPLPPQPQGPSNV